MNQQASRLFRAARSAAIDLKDKKAIPRLLRLKKEFPAATARRKGQIRAQLRRLVERNRSAKLVELQQP